MASGRDHILARVTPIALGNSNRKPMHVASDLINASNQHFVTIAAGTFLSAATVKRLAECNEPYRPQGETLDRIMEYFGVQITYSEVEMQSEFMPQPKT